MDGPDGNSYQARATRVGHGGSVRAGIVAVALVGLVALAVVKPWGSPAGISREAASSAPVLAAPLAASAIVSRSPGASAVGASRTAPSSSPVTGAAPKPTVAPDPLFGPLIARLAARSGGWGIGSGGWGISPVSGSPWTGWEPVEPATLGAAIRRPRAPSCADLPWLRVGIVVAITAPPDLPPDWTVAVSSFRVDGAVVSGPGAIQVSPPGNRGVAYLVEPDSAQWRSGAYRFTIRTVSASVVMDACLVAL